MTTRRSDADIDSTAELVPWAAPSLPPIIKYLGDGQGFTAERRTPTRAPALESDVYVPGLQSVISAVVTVIAAAGLVWVFMWSAKILVILFGAVLLLAWVARLRFLDSLLYTSERVTAQGRNEHSITPPYLLANADAARTQVAAERERSAQDEQRASLLAFLDKCYTLGTSESAHGVLASGPERRRYVEARDALMRLGLAAWRNPGRQRAGWLLTCSHQRARNIIERHIV